MDVPVAEGRSSVPNWAQNRGPSESQRRFILSLRDEREMTDEQRKWIDDNIDSLTPGRDGKASEVITRLLKLPKRHTAETEIVSSVPAGRYAVDSNEGELRFYQVWRPKDNPNFFMLYVLHGPDSSKVQRNAIEPIMRKIAADVRGAAIRFGNEIGSCSNCGRRLTNRISRELGIGPVCGGRMFDDGDWKQEVKDARQRIIDRGDNPEEEIE